MNSAKQGIAAEDLRTAGEILGAGLAAMDLEFSVHQQRQLLNYLELLHKWNHSYNLTAVRDLQQMVARHLLDCLSLSPLLAGVHVLDIGSGAGLPGLVLAITEPCRHFVLLDSALKRTRFLNQAVHELQLTNVRVERARAENFKPARKFDCMVSRAALAFDDLIKVADSLLDKGAVLLAMQGRLPAQACDYTRRGVVFERLRVPGMDAHRHVAIYHRR